MSEQFREVGIGLVTYPPPGIDKATDTRIGGPVDLSVDSAIISRIVLDRGQVRHMAATPVGGVIPHIIECKDRTIGIDRVGDSVERTAMCIYVVAIALYAYPHKRYKK